MIRFEGVMPALVTPLKEDETLNAAALRKLLEGLLAQGADGFYIGGATGEGIALPRQVREELAEESVKALAGRKPAIVHIASADYAEAIALAKHAEACGADGISAIPPLFYRYDKEDVYQYYKGLAEATGLPLMVYYNPAAGFAIDAAFAARLFEIDNVTAIKWTSPDYFGMMRLRDLTHGEMNIINGPDEMLLMGLAAGADGGIGTTYNFQMETIRKVYDSFRAGDMAGALEAQTQADRVVSMLFKYSTLPVTKVLLEAQGYDVGNTVRPLKHYTAEEKKQIVEDFRSVGVKV